MKSQSEILHSPFDAETHKQFFINYLEAIIREDGTVEYATPSHQEKLIAVGCEVKNVERQKLLDMCPKKHYFDFMNWLCSITKSVAIWTEQKVGIPNEKQQETLKYLYDQGLYKGQL